MYKTETKSMEIAKINIYLIVKKVNIQLIFFG